MPENLQFRRLTITFGLLAAATSIIGILITHFGITSIGSASTNNRTIALSAALIWIFIGSILAYQTAKPFHRITGLFVQAVLFLIAVIETIEFIFNVQGGHFFIETLFVKAGTIILGPSSTPISPVAAGLAFPAAIALVLIIRNSGQSVKTGRVLDTISVIGWFIVLISFTFVLSYAYGSPLMYGTQYIPIALPSALSALFIGVTLVASAGPDAVPVKWMIGTTTSARLLRVFLPLVIGIVLIENIAFVDLPSWFSVHDTILLSATLVIFALTTAYVAARVAGGMGRTLEQAEQELVRKNEDLNALNEELIATQEELRQTNDDLLVHERNLTQKNEDLNALNEELTATQEELRQTNNVLLANERQLMQKTDDLNALNEELSKLAAIVENSDDAIIGKSLDGTIISWNASAEKMYGYSASEVIGRNISILVPPDRIDDFEYVLGEIKKGDPFAHYETQRIKKDGSIIHVSLTLSPIRDRTEKLVGVSTIAHDITERKKAENALRETSQYLNNLINYANAPIIVWDPEFKITRFNHAFELLTGMTAGEVIGEDLGILFPEKYRDASMEVIRKTTCGEWLHVVEIPIIRTNGDVRIVLWNSATLYEPDGKTISSTIAQGQDITERKVAEAENIRAREEWEQTFNTVPDLIAVLNLNHRIIRVNRAMAERLGTTPEKCIGLLCHEIVHGTSVPPAFCPHLMTCADGQQHIVEVQEPGLGGHFIVSTTPLSDTGGTIFGTVHVAHDITDRKKAEDELKQKNEDLNALNEELSRREQDLTVALTEKEVLLSEIHHRVKNNLTAFISLLSLEGSTEDTPAGKMLKQDLQNRARSMALIHETLYRTNMFDEVDMGMYLTNLLDQIANTFKTKRSVKVVVNAEGVLLDIPRATPAGLIINELVTNSFKYAFPESFDTQVIRNAPPTITIALAKNDGTYVMTVKDNGAGLPPGLDLTKTQSLGLKLVNFLAKHQMRAKVEVNSTAGTEFVFRFGEVTKK